MKSRYVANLRAQVATLTEERDRLRKALAVGAAAVRSYGAHVYAGIADWLQEADAALDTGPPSAPPGDIRERLADLAERTARLAERGEAAVRAETVKAIVGRLDALAKEHEALSEGEGDAEGRAWYRGKARAARAIHDTIAREFGAKAGGGEP